MPGGRFGKYRLLARIGAGSTGEVLLASDGEREVALKRPLPHLRDRPSTAAFANEARLAARLHHPNLVEVFEVGVIDEIPYLAMEYLAGTNLHRLLRAVGEPPVGMAAFIGREVARGLAHLHCVDDGAGRPLDLVHRDVTPSNILLSAAGQVKLCDLGIAKALAEAAAEERTRSGLLKGKLEYLAPEQVRGEAIDQRADLFALGSVLYEVLTGRCLFGAPTDPEVIERVREARVDPPSLLRPEIPGELERACLGALAGRREDRFASAAEMASALDAVVADLGFGRAELAALVAPLAPPTGARPAETTRTLAPGRARGRWLWIGVGVAATALAGGALLLARRRPAAPPLIAAPPSARPPPEGSEPVPPPPALPAKVAAPRPPRARPPARAAAPPARAATPRAAPPPPRPAGAKDLMPNPFAR